MSTLKADNITSKTSGTDLSISGLDGGVPNLEANFKVGGVAGIGTASIQDDAVTLAKMASGTDGNLITYDASGNPAHVSTGTATHVLTSNGAGAAPTFQAAAGGGAWTRIASSTASSSSSIIITGLSNTYATFAVAFNSMLPSANANMQLRFGNSGGVISTSNYDFNYLRQIEGSYSHDSVTFQNASGFELGQSVSSTAAESNFSGMFFIHPDYGGTGYTHMTGHGGHMNDGGTYRGGPFSGQYGANITLDRIEVYFSTGNITSGRLTVWGISHA